MDKFEEYSKKVITDFLQTVVVVDDEAFLIEENKVAREEARETEKKARATMRGAATDTGTVTTTNNPGDKHGLDAKALSDKFAESGLMCTALRPTADEFDSYEKVLKKADIVILDWKLKKGDTGSTVKKLIEKIIEDTDGNTQKALRNIVIYSGEEDLQDKLKSVKEYFQEKLGDPTEKTDYSLNYEKLQIKIYAKKVFGKVRLGNERKIEKNEEELVEAIIEDFTNQVAGLVPNMAIESLAQIRKNTHKMLGVFSKDLDEAYLSHRALLPYSQDAESFMIDIFISELQSILEDSNKIYEAINLDQIMNWIKKELDDDRLLRIFFNNDIVNHTKSNKHANIKTKFDIERDFQLSDQTNFSTASTGIIKYRRELLYELLEEIFSQGYTKTINCELIKQKKFNPKEFTSYFFKDDSSANENENKFAMLTTTKNKYSKPIPYLSLGTVLKNNNKHYICIIPRCDAARLANNEQQFPFLYLEPVLDNKNFDIVLKGSEGFLKFKIDYEPYNIFVQSFRKPIRDYNVTNRPLYADEMSGQYVFATHSDDCYMWITELKNEKAQAILNKFAAKLSRVGFNESEYLRRSYDPICI